MSDVPSTPSRPEKWELSFLFDATEDEAAALLERISDEVWKHNGSAGAGLRRITNLPAWEQCRCGTGKRRRPE